MKFKKLQKRCWKRWWIGLTEHLSIHPWLNTGHIVKMFVMKIVNKVNGQNLLPTKHAKFEFLPVCDKCLLHVFTQSLVVIYIYNLTPPHMPSDSLTDQLGLSSEHYLHCDSATNHLHCDSALQCYKYLIASNISKCLSIPQKVLCVFDSFCISNRCLFKIC